MARVPEETIERIRNTADIYDVVAQYVDLKKRGRNFFGLCPFHSEKTPSFSVAPDKQIYHCFGCGAGGNVFSFIVEILYQIYHLTIFIATLDISCHIKLVFVVDHIMSLFCLVWIGLSGLL